MAIIIYVALQTVHGMWLTVKWEAHLEEASMRYAGENVSLLVWKSPADPFLEWIKYAAAAAAGMLTYAGLSALLARRRRRDNLKRPQP
ncbi:hypothetical protein ACE6ED_10555 [Paenibacillus sp. CN-4]|uniref:hypothetical protein n=1 Tax=Paenibacillus nanchangensis TaxID=3348343 RepID=UPI00397BAFD2